MEFSDGVTTEPVFYFPAWSVQCGGAPAVTFAAHPHTAAFLQRHGLRANAWDHRHRMKVGGALSFFGLLALIATGAISLRRRKPS